MYIENYKPCPSKVGLFLYPGVGKSGKPPGLGPGNRRFESCRSENYVLFIGAWCSLVAFLNGVQAVRGSNPLAPTIKLFMKIYNRGNGYQYIILHDHPFSDKRGRISYHRYLMEQKIGRYLLPSEVVHHKDGNKENNRKSNLIITERSKHTKHHKSTGRTFKEFNCRNCGRLFKREKKNIRVEKPFCSKKCVGAFYTFSKKKITFLHGTYNKYRQGCRCEDCRKAQASRGNHRRQGHGQEAQTE